MLVGWMETNLLLGVSHTLAYVMQASNQVGEEVERRRRRPG